MVQQKKIRSLHIIIDKIINTHFDKIKVCVFILTCFKNDIDCIMIDMPLKEINPQIRGVALEPNEARSFAPWVTSASPYNKPENSFVEIHHITTIAIISGYPLLIVIVGGIYVVEALSVIIQVTSFKLTGKRVFKMAPIHHHFEQCGWNEVKVVTVFSIITVVLCIIGFFAI